LCPLFNVAAFWTSDVAYEFHVCKVHRSPLRLIVVVDCFGKVAFLFTECCYTISRVCVKFQIIFIVFKCYIPVDWYFSQYYHTFWRKLNLMKVKIMLKWFPPTLRSHTLGIDAHFPSLLTAGLGGGEWFIWCTFCFTPWAEYPGTLWVDSVGHRVSLGVLTLPRIEPRIVQP
jgi:hypothetical protein